MESFGGSSLDVVEVELIRGTNNWLILVGEWRVGQMQLTQESATSESVTYRQSDQA